MSIASAIDVALVKLTAAHVDIDTGRVMDRRVLDTRPGRGGEAVLADVAGLARGLGRSVLAVGIALPEEVGADGAVLSGRRFDWRELDLVEPFEALPGVRLVGRGAAGALAEARFGAGRERAGFVYLEAGPALDPALCRAGRPLFPPDDPTGALRDLEAAAGPAIAMAADTQTLAQALARDEAETAIRTGGSALGAAIAALGLDVDLLILGGPLGLDERYQAGVAEAAGLAVEPAALGLDAPLVGAALAAV
ncbi:MAG: hypothetical protein ACO3KD_09285 [Gaiellales bacterium]